MKSFLFTFLALLSCLTAGAVCTASFTSSTTGNSASFTNTSTYSGYVNPTAFYYISFGDGSNSYAYNTLGAFSHNYVAPGTYTVTLVLHVEDSTSSGIQFCTDTVAQSIVILPSPCASYITVGAASSSSLVRTFTANNYAGTPGMTYNWYFGDGTSGTGSPVSHTYTSAGTYQVVLVSTGGGCIDSAFSYVTVTAPFNCATVNASMSYYGSGTSMVFSSSLSPVYMPGYTAVRSWNFGDGSTGTGTTLSHIYAAPGTYQVTLLVQWVDDATGLVVCQDTAMSNVTVITCAGVAASYTYTVSGNTANFTNTSTTGAMPGAVVNYYWFFDDGTSSAATNPTHSYAAAGTYTVSLSIMVTDSLGISYYCSDSIWQVITVGNPPNIISGSIGMDSSYYNPSVIDTFKVWLIEFDSTSQMLYAVDSQIVSGPYNGVSYEFLNKAPGVYRTKAAHLNGPSFGTGLLPTYHAYSLYWNTATQIYHAGGSTIYKHIHMQGGTVTGGPGFIGGNVTMGANKGTAVGDPVAGLLVFLRDASDKVIRMTYTDASGDFSFGSLPIGNYSVYPEALNYTTTPYTSIVVNTSQPSVPNIFFKQTEDLEIRPIPTSVGGPGAVAAGKVYPNPARDLLNITVPAQTSQLQVSVISLTGRVLASHEFRNVAAGAVRSISVKELPAGLYLVRTLADGQSRTEKVQIH